MKQPIAMPALSDTMSNGRLAKWLKQPGDKVKSGEAIAEVETDKAIMEVEAFHDGYLAGPLAATDSEFPVGQTIGYIADTAAEAVTASQPAASESANATVKATAKTAATVTATAAPAVSQAASQAAVAETISPILAAAGVNRFHGRRHLPPNRTTTSRTTGADQPIGAKQEKTTTGPAPANFELAPPYRLERLSPLRDAVARNMIASAAAPTFHVTAQISLKPLMETAGNKKLSFTVALARTCARVIADNPLFNAAYTPEGLARRDRIDIGIAVDTPDGLITPVLRDAGQRALASLAEDWAALLERTKTRRLAPADYRGATFYISNLGTFPVVRSFDSIVPEGASAILSVGAAREEGAHLTLSCDHRVVFGGDAARFLQSLGERLATPEL